MKNLLDSIDIGLMDVSTKVQAMLLKAFNASIDFVYTQISIVFDFITQPIVLGTLAGLGVIYMGYRWVRGKTSSIG